MHLVIVSHILALLNRLYAHYSFIVNYALYAILWIFLRGAPPNRDATVNRAKGWSPGVFVACSEGPVGTALVLQLAKEGYTVHAGVSSIDEGEKLVRRWKNLGSSNGGTVRPVVYDISDPLSIRRAADNLQTYDEAHSHRRLVSVICNPGSMIVSPFHSLHDEQIDTTIDTNLRSNMTLIRVFLALLSTTSAHSKPLQMRLIVLSSFTSYTPLPGLAIPAAMASALDSLARALMVEEQNRNIRTTIIRTGFIRGSVPRIADSARDCPTVRRWRGIIWCADRLGTPVEYVAAQVTDALTDRWMQPCYTLGCDALLAQALRDFVPEPIYEWALVKVLGSASGAG